MAKIDELHAASVSSDLALLKQAVMKALSAGKNLVAPRAAAQAPTTENVGTPKAPIWKVSANGEETPEQAMARWLMMMAETTGGEQFNQGDPDSNYMSDLQDIFPEQPETPDAQR